MQAPIPAVPEQREHIEKTRPAGLKAVTLLLCFFNLTNYLWMEWVANELWFQLIFFTFLIALYYVVLWRFWNGYNWARILVLVVSVFVLNNIFYFGENTLLQKIVSTADMTFSIFLLYWLNTKSIREYFKQPKVNKAS